MDASGDGHVSAGNFAQPNQDQGADVLPGQSASAKKLRRFRTDNDAPAVADDQRTWVLAELGMLNKLLVGLECPNCDTAQPLTFRTTDTSIGLARMRDRMFASK